MTTLSQRDFQKAHSLGHGELTKAEKLHVFVRQFVDTKIAEEMTSLAKVNLAREVIRETGASYIGETLDGIVPSRNLQRAAENAASSAVKLGLKRAQQTR